MTVKGVNVHAQDCIVLDDKASKLNSCVSVDVLESSPSAYKVRFKIHKIGCDSISKDGADYQILSLGSSSLQETGEPALPTILQHIGIPTGKTISTELVENEWEDISVGKIYPAQEPELWIHTDPEFDINDSIYLCDTYSSPLLGSSEVMNWKGIDNIYLTLCPFRYHPSSNKLSVLSDFTLSVVFSEDRENAQEAPKYGEKDLNVFDNYNFLPSESATPAMRGTASSDSCDYLIVVGNIPAIENSESMATFRKWKALKGHKTKMVSISSVGTDTTMIKNYLSQQYDAGIRYVLFVGNNEHIPVAVLPPFTDSIPMRKSDYWYGCFGGASDMQSEIPIGRFPVNTLEGFSNMVSKTVKYESLQHVWVNRNLLVSHEQIQNFQDSLEAISNTTFNHPLVFYKAYGAPVSLGGLGSNKYDVIDYINDGMNLVTINCHGNAGAFWMFDGDNSTITYEDRVLLNDDTYPVIFSNACYNGDFINYIHSIAAYFSCSDHCSTAYLGTTMPSYIKPGNTYLRHLYTKLLNQDVCILGDLVLSSHISNLENGKLAKDNAFNYICGGDPTLEIWTGIQQQFGDVDISANGENLVITVEGVDSFKVNVVRLDGVLVAKYLSSSSSVSMPKPTFDCEIAIDKHDYVPYIIRINADDQYIQDITFDKNVYYEASPLSVGYDVTQAQAYGNVTVEPNARLMLNKGSGVTIKNGFECKQGGELIIK